MGHLLELLCAPSIADAAAFADRSGWESMTGQPRYWRKPRTQGGEIVMFITGPEQLEIEDARLKCHLHFPGGVPAAWLSALAGRTDVWPYRRMDDAPTDRPIRVFDAKRRVWQTCRWEQRTRDFGAWFIVGTGAWISAAACWMECEMDPPAEIIEAVAA